MTTIRPEKLKLLIERQYPNTVAMSGPYPPPPSQVSSVGRP